MKLNSILSLLKQRKRVVIHNSDSAQWIGDGFASYPIYSLPYLSEESMQMLLGIDFEAWSKYTYDYIDRVPFSEEDFTSDEISLSELEVEVSYRGCDMILLSDGARVYYIEKKYLKPFSDFESMFFYRSCEKMIAVKEGMLLRGLIIPHHFAEVSRKELIEELRKAYLMTDGMLKELAVSEQAEKIAEDLGFVEGSENE